jgi:hypothetical protein
MHHNRAMRPRRICLVTAAFLALTVAAAASGAPRPALVIRSDLPLTLHGSGFRANEAVRVTVLMGERRWVRNVRAGLAGGFTVRFAGVRLLYCSTPLVITARGPRSGTVSAKIPIRECPPP